MGVLGRSDLEARVDPGVEGKGEIFVDGTWSRDQFRPAAYDLRIGCEYLITPSGTRYWRGAANINHRELKESFRIEPGQVAFVSSEERLVMPDDLAANVAIKFRTALNGIFVVGGLLVDPGYRGHLHFQLANVGKEPFTVVPGHTSVAALQFLPVSGKVSPDSDPPETKKLLDDLFFLGATEPLPQFAFFPKAAAIEDRLATVGRLTEEHEVEIRATKRSTDQLVVFGVFVLSATLFSVAVAALIDALATGTYEKAGKVLVSKTEFSLVGVVAAIAVVLVIGLAIAKMMTPLLEVLRKDPESDN